MFVIFLQIIPMEHFIIFVQQEVASSGVVPCLSSSMTTRLTMFHACKVELYVQVSCCNLSTCFFPYTGHPCNQKEGLVKKESLPLRRKKKIKLYNCYIWKWTVGNFVDRSTSFSTFPYIVKWNVLVDVS